MKKIKYYLIKLKLKSDLIYRKSARVKPWYVFVFLSILNKVPTRLLGFAEIFFRLFRLKCNFTVLNKKLRFYIHSNIQNFKYHGGMIPELRVSENFLRLIPPQSIFYDVGSALGWYSILVSDKCKKIIGFDPYDKSSLLNVSLNKIDNFEFYPYFLSDHQQSDNSTVTTTIDELIRCGFPVPNVIKLDVEGEECKILCGGKILFTNNPPEVVLIETHSEKLFYDCIKFLRVFNYRVYNLGCPKINTGGDIYLISYNLGTDAFITKSETRTILGLRR